MFAEILREARINFVKEYDKDLAPEIREEVLAKMDSHFFNWLRKKSEPDKAGEVDTGALTGEECCMEFEQLVNFEIGKHALEAPHCYLGNNIIMQLAMSVKELVLCFDKINLLKKYPPPQKRDEDAFDANWAKKSQPVSFHEQCSSQFNALPTRYKAYLKDKDEDW